MFNHTPSNLIACAKKRWRESQRVSKLHPNRTKQKNKQTEVTGFAQQVLLDACFNHRRAKMDMMPPAPPAGETEDHWNQPVGPPAPSHQFKVNFPPRHPSWYFLSVVSQQLILILLRIYRFLTAFRTFSGLRTVGQRQASGQICWQRSGSTPPRTSKKEREKDRKKCHHEAVTDQHRWSQHKAFVIQWQCWEIKKQITKKIYCWDLLGWH